MCNKFRKFIASLLCFNILFSNVPVVLWASDITGVQGENGVYNITPQSYASDTGFRAYENFTLDAGDTANLVFDDTYSSFVNVVDNRININGFLNTVKNNGFYAGKAYFITKSGIVIGSSGVLNVGSLGLISTNADRFSAYKEKLGTADAVPGSDLYRNLYVTVKDNEVESYNTDGSIEINGTIFARQAVDAYANSISVEGRGVVAGWNPEDGNILFGTGSGYKSFEEAKNTFNSLVSGDVTSAAFLSNKDSEGTEHNRIFFNAMAYQQGDKDDEDWKGSSAEIKVTDAHLVAPDVELSASSFVDSKHLAFDFLDITGGIFADYAKSKITLTNSTVKANTAYFDSSAKSTSTANINSLPPVLWTWLCNLFEEQDEKKWDEGLGKLFSSELFEHFDGTRSYSSLDIKDTTVLATGDIDAKTNASASFTAESTLIPEILPQVLYALGTETESVVNVDNSTLNSASGNVDVNALSKNKLLATVADDSGLFKFSLVTDAYNFRYMNVGTSVNTAVNILNNSRIKAAKDIILNAFSYEDVFIKTDISATVGKNDFQSGNKGGSGAAFSFIHNNSDIKTNVNIDSSTVEAGGSVDVKAENAAAERSSVSSKTTPAGYTPPEKIEKSDSFFGKIKNGFKYAKGLYDKARTYTVQSLGSVFRAIYNKASGTVQENVENAAGEGQTLDPALFQAAGSFAFSFLRNTNSITLKNSTVTAGNNIDFFSHIYDLSFNSALALARQDDDQHKSAIVGAGIAVVLNEKENKNDIIVQDSTVNAIGENSKTNINAVTEIPGNAGSLGLDHKYLHLSLKFNMDASDDWTADFVPWESSKESMVNPTLGLSGFFSNEAVAGTTGDKAALSASVVVNNTKNNTNVLIKNSEINSFDFSTYATNYITGRDSAGIQLNTPASGVMDLINLWNSDGTGGSVLVQNMEHNAKVNIEKSTISLTGSADIGAASAQAYFNFLKQGTKAGTLGLSGAVEVQNIKGTTAVNVTDNSVITAQGDISLNAGRTKSILGDMTYEGDVKGTPSVSNDSSMTYRKDPESTTEPKADKVFDITDHITTIDVLGDLSQQAERKSVSAAVGVSANVHNIDRDIQAVTDNAELASNAGSVTSDAYSSTKALDFAIAAAISEGGKPTDNNMGNWQNNANNAGANAQNAQDVGNNVRNALNGAGGEDGQNGVQAAGGAASGAGSTYFNLSATGAINVFDNNQRILSVARNNSRISAANSVRIDATSDNFNIFFSGALANSGTVGLGAAVNLYTRGGSVKALLDSASVTAGSNAADASAENSKGIRVVANDKTSSYNLAAGVGISGNTEEKFSLGLGGSFAYNMVKPEITASVSASTLKGTQDNGLGSGTDVTVEAKGELDTVDVSGGIDMTTSGNISVGAAAAVTVDYMESKVSALVENSVLDEKVRNVSVHAGEDIDLLGVGVSLGLTGVDTKVGVGIDGSVGIVNLNNNIQALYAANETDAAGQVAVKADSKAAVKNIEGAGQFNAAQNGAGVGGAVVVDLQNSTLKAAIETRGFDFSAKGVSVEAVSNEELNSIPVGVAISKQSSLLSSTVSVGVVKNNAKAYILGLVNSTGDVLVRAEDRSYLLTRGGTLAATGSSSTPTVIGASVNVDILNKTVEADISDSTISAQGQTVSVRANSVDAFGGSGNTDERDDITSSSYNDTLMQRNSDGEYSGIKTDQGFDKWNMFWNIAAGSTVPISGTVVIKNTDNNVRALVENTKLDVKDLNITALERQMKNIVGGQVSAGKTAAVGVQVVLTYDKSNVTASLAKSSSVTAAGNTAIEASAIKDNNTVMVSAAGSGNASGNVNVMYNSVSDTVSASMDNSNLTSSGTVSALDIKATEDFNSTRVVVQAAGAGQGAAINVAPLINDYTTNVFSFAKDGSVSGAAASIGVQDLFKTRDISVGVSGVGQGASATGVAIRNNYSNTAAAYALNLKTTGLRSLAIDAANYINSSNWIVGVSGMGMGAALAAGVLINDVNSNTSAYIQNSDIESDGDVSVSVNEGKQDKIFNFALLGAGGGEGATVAGNFVFNYYRNTAKALIENSAVKAANIRVKAVSDRDLNTKNISASGTGIGGNVGVNVSKNTNMTDTFAGIDSADYTVEATSKVSVDAQDTTRVKSDIGSGSVAGIGGAGLANVNLIYNNVDSHAVINTSGSGEVVANDVEVTQNARTGVSALDVGIVAGAGAIAGDVTIVRVGDRDSYTDTYTQLENKAGLANAENQANERQKGVMGVSAVEAGNNRGFTAEINGNVNALNNVGVSSSSTLENYDQNSPFKLTNVNVSAAGGAVNVGWLSGKFYFNNSALISGGSVNAGNKVSVSAKESDSAEISNVKVQATAVLGVEGGISSYSNSSTTNAVIKDATVVAKDVEVVSDVTTSAKTDITDVQFSGGAAINVAGYETLINAQSNALVTGNTHIVAQEDMNVHATESLDVSGESTLVKVALVTGGYVSNTVRGKAQVSALVKDLTGSVLARNLNITTDYSKMEGSSRSNLVSVSGVGIDFSDSSFTLNPVFMSGIDSLTGGVIRTENTNVVTAKPLNNSKMNAFTDLSSVSVNLAGGGKAGAYTLNEATSATVMKAAGHKAGKAINVDAYLDSTSKAQMSSTGVSIVFGVRDTEVAGTSKSHMTVDFDGYNSAKDINVKAVHNAETNVSLGQVGASVLANVSVIDLKGDNSADTNVKLAGSTVANALTFDVNTNRTGILNLTTGNGGFVNVSSSSASNSVTGQSELTIDGYKPVSSESGDITIKSVTLNRQQNVTSDSSGGFVSVSPSSQSYNFDTKNTLNVKNSEIRTDGVIKLSVESKNLVEDDASSGAGGFVSVAKDSSSNSYKAETEFNIDNTVIDATDVVLSASSDISTAADEISYRISNGGFIPVSKLELTNTLTQNNTINIRGNSILRATRNFDVTAASGYSHFKQNADTSSSGFITVATVKTTLNSNNTNTVNVESGSLVRGDSVVSFNFESNGNLRTYSHVKIKDAGSDPETNAKLYLTVNNTFNLSGTVEAGKTARVSFMEDSENNLDQEAYSEHYALAPFTTEGGELKRSVNNTLNITQNMGRIISGRDVNIGFSSGRGDLKSNIHYHLVYYSWFGKNSYGGHSNLSTPNDYKFDLSGEIVAGYGNNKKAVLNTDGDVDMTQSHGLYASDYILVGSDDTEADARRIQALITSLTSQFEAEQTAKERAEASLSQAKQTRDSLLSEQSSVAHGIDEVNSYLNSGYAEATEENLSNRINQDFGAYLTDNSSSSPDGSGIMPAEYMVLKELFDNWYNTHRDEYEDQSTLEVFVKYASTVYTGLSADQIVRLNAAETEFITGTDARIKYITAGTDSNKTTFTVYSNKIDTEGYKYRGIVLKNREKNILDGVMNHYADLGSRVADYSVRIADLETKIGQIEQTISVLGSELAQIYRWTPSYYESSYAILFNPMKFSAGSVTISGIDEGRITPPDWRDQDHIKYGKAGLEVQNYSTRSVIFEDIDFSGASDREPDVIVNNYADSRNPFYIRPVWVLESNLNNIVFIRPVTLHPEMNLIAKTVSGSIWANLKDATYKNLDFTAEQENVTLTAADGGLTSGNVSVKAGDKIFAGNSIVVGANGTVNVAGTLTAGNNADRKLIITSSMLLDENLVTDPTTGEKNMLKIEGTDNTVNAIYKDGEIHLFSIGETGRSVILNAGQSGGSVSGTVYLNGGSAKIDIDNQTDKTLVLHEIKNIHHNAVLQADNVSVPEERVVRNNPQIGEANVTINSINELLAEGRIISGASEDGNGGYTWDSDTDNGNLELLASDRLYVGEQFDENGNEIPAIVTGSVIGILSQSGGVEVEGIIHTDKIVTLETNDEPVYFRKMIVNTAALMTRTEDITLDSVEVLRYGRFFSNSKDFELNNEDVSVNKNVDAQLFTGRTGAFSLNINNTNRVETTAPVVIRNNKSLLVWNYLGYHTFDTLTHTETTLLRESLKAVPANTFSSGAFTFGFSETDESLVEGDGRIAR